jgi:hypothetical protein
VNTPLKVPNLVRAWVVTACYRFQLEVGGQRIAGNLIDVVALFTGRSLLPNLASAAKSLMLGPLLNHSVLIFP